MVDHVGFRALGQVQAAQKQLKNKGLLAHYLNLYLSAHPGLRHFALGAGRDALSLSDSGIDAVPASTLLVPARRCEAAIVPWQRNLNEYCLFKGVEQAFNVDVSEHTEQDTILGLVMPPQLAILQPLCAIHQ